MALTLYLHPLASFCHKVLIGLYENDVPFRAETVNFMEPGAAAAHLERWPVGKIPVLHDAALARTIPETTIILEYLQQHYPGPVRLFPDEAEARLEARLWDRFFDLYVSVPMQKIVLDRLRPKGDGDPLGVAEARGTLDTAYAMIDARIAEGPWVMGEQFTIAECAAAPALFFASIVHPFGAGETRLAAYFERLLERPSIARTFAEARPFFAMFPYRDAMPERLLEFGR